MKRSRHTPDQIVRKLREADRLLAEGMALPDVCRQLEVSLQTYHRWRTQYSAARPDDVARLKNLGRENAHLKRLLAERNSTTTCSGRWLREMVTPRRGSLAVRDLQDRFGVSERGVCKVLSQHRFTQGRASPDATSTRITCVRG